MTNLTFNTHGSLVCLHDALALIESDTKPFFLGGLKWMKQCSQDSWWNAWAIIGDGDDSRVFTANGSDFDCALFPARLLGIQNHVEQDLLNLIPLHPHWWKVRLNPLDRYSQSAVQ
jgi:hypothetical protein